MIRLPRPLPCPQKYLALVGQQKVRRIRRRKDTHPFDRMVQAAAGIYRTESAAFAMVLFVLALGLPIQVWPW